MPTFRQDEKLGTKVPLIKTADFNDKSVTTEKLAEGSVTNSKLAPESVTQDKFDKELLQIFEAATGLPENLIETIQNVDSTLADHQRQISSNDDDISDLQTKTKQIKDTVDGIAISGGASVGSAVTYDNTQSGLDAQNIQNAIDELVNNLGHYETNEEWLRVYTDAENKFLWGIRVDGSIDWAVGIPRPIQKKIEELIATDTAIQESITQLRTELTESLNKNIKSLKDNEIKNLQDTKVDKEEGKSLIEDEVKECFRVIENEEFIYAVIDSEDRLLFGIYRDSGKPYFPLNEMYHVEQNEEFFAVWLDAANHVLLGIRRDGEIIGEIHAANALKQVISQLQSDLVTLQEKVGTIDTNLKELLDVFSLQENPEYMAVETDAEGKILSSTNADGSHYIHKAKSETIPEEFSHIEDPEGRMSMETDAEQRILAYRDKDGVKHEHEMDVKTLHVSNLNLTANSVNDIQSALIANGFNVKAPIDWSESSFIQIPEPHFAIINITNIDSMPTTKTQNKKAFLEFWDMQGNYFKKHAILNAQGQSSLNFIKKNVAIDLCDDEWIGEETPKVRIGNWVLQDSFHMKAYYTDFFRGVGAICYKLYNQIVKTRGDFYDRPWKKALIDNSQIGVTTKSIGNLHAGDLSLLTDTGARCFPDGFPVACYLNGEFYGIFSWQLKKHRDNYHMNKSTAEHIHIDGGISEKSIFDGNIDWSQFEIRNPKGLYAIGGNKYDADIRQEEIAGDNEINSWIEKGKMPDGTTISSKIKKSLEMTAKVKGYIVKLSTALSKIKSASSVYESSLKTEEDLSAFKSVFEAYFDKDNLIDYIIISDVIKNTDGFDKNWQWFTYDGRKWFVGLYDCDVSFGAHFMGNQTTSPYSTHLDENLKKPTGYIIKYYSKELAERYKILADAGIISYENITALIKDWCFRIGTDNYKKEYDKWVNSPCVGESVVNTEYWAIQKDTNGDYILDTTESFNATKAYSVGDLVSFGLNQTMGFYKFECVKPTVALASNSPHSISTYSPFSEFRHSDNIYRIEKWIAQNLKNMDNLYNYKR